MEMTAQYMVLIGYSFNPLLRIRLFYSIVKVQIAWGLHSEVKLCLCHRRTIDEYFAHLIPYLVAGYIIADNNKHL